MSPTRSDGDRDWFAKTQEDSVGPVGPLDEHDDTTFPADRREDTPALTEGTAKNSRIAMLPQSVLDDLEPARENILGESQRLEDAQAALRPGGVTQ